MRSSKNDLIGTLVTACLIRSATSFQFQWPSTIEAPEIQNEPTELQKKHIEAIDDVAITISGESVDVDVLANDLIHSSNKKSLSLSLKGRGNNGYCVIEVESDFIIYYPMFRYAGYDECEYTVCDDAGFCDTAKISITVVKAVNESDDDSSSKPDPYRPPIDESNGDEPVDYSNDVALDFFSCPKGQVSITIEVQADKYGEDTTWVLARQYEDGSTVSQLAGGPYKSNEFDSAHTCAPDESKWTFTIFDQYGDGFCCNFGDGFYRIFLDSSEIIHVSHFNENITNVINVGFHPAPIMTTRDFEYLHAHNKRRKKWHEMHNASYVPLKWSPKLAEMSLKWAIELLADCDSSGIEHEPNIKEGENLAKNHGSKGWGQLYPPDNIVRRWVDFEATWPWPENAHLTQALWRASKYMGCGESVKDWRGGKCRVQVCRYAKTGNCDMGHYNSTEGQDWLTPMLASYSPCEPSCPPEGCW